MIIARHQSPRAQAVASVAKVAGGVEKAQAGGREQPEAGPATASGAAGNGRSCGALYMHAAACSSPGEEHRHGHGLEKSLVAGLGAKCGGSQEPLRCTAYHMAPSRSLAFTPSPLSHTTPTLPPPFD